MLASQRIVEARENDLRFIVASGNRLDDSPQLVAGALITPHPARHVSAIALRCDSIDQCLIGTCAERVSFAVSHVPQLTTQNVRVAT